MYTCTTQQTFFCHKTSQGFAPRQVKEVSACAWIWGTAEQGQVPSPAGAITPHMEW